VRSLTQDLVRQAIERAVDHLAKDPRVRLVYLYGSAARAGEARVRDIDLAILTDPALSLEELMRLRADLVQAARTEVDVVSLNVAPVVLAHEVVDAGQSLYANPAEIQTDFVTRARACYWDFKPFLEEQWRLAGERLEHRRRGA
jgi:predicted nucleotidyltransferase